MADVPGRQRDPDDGTAAEVFAADLDDVRLLVVEMPAHPERPELTPAEREVVALVLEGRSNRDIAAARGVSVKTVANQLRAVYEKLGIASRFELAAEA